MLEELQRHAVGLERDRETLAKQSAPSTGSGTRRR
jgi:hypothetical protein